MITRTPEREAQATESVELMLSLHELLAGKPPEVQGAAIMQLLALFIAGHHPAIRRDAFEAITDAVPDMVKVAEYEIFGPGGFPTEGVN